MEIQNKIIKQVILINSAFYDAFAAGDFLAVKDIWSKHHQTSVIHPGSAALHGQKAVMMSWEIIFKNSGSHDIKCINERVYLVGESAYVVCSEIFPGGHQLIATNIFVIEDGSWRMVHHQAGPGSGSDLRHERMPDRSTSIH